MEGKAVVVMAVLIAAQKAMFEDSVHAKNGVTCVDCHMAKMGNRAGAPLKTPKDPFGVSAHAMRVVTPAEVEVFKMRSSCDACHKDENRAANGAKLAAARQAVWDKLGEAQARENLNTVLTDGTFSAHNPEEALKLLELKK